MLHCEIAMTNMSRMTAMLVLTLALAALMSCGRSADGPTATPTRTPLQEDIEDAAAAWESQAITDYQMNVKFRHPGWNVQVLDVSVSDGTPVVESHTCFPERSCAVRQVDASRLTVANLIAELRRAAAQGIVEHVVYHDTFAFPRIITTGEDSWEISNFRVADGQTE
jgi:hypothetical protein